MATTTKNKDNKDESSSLTTKKKAPSSPPPPSLKDKTDVSLDSHHPFEYEFGGPVGAFLTTISLPIVILLLIHFASVGQVDTSLFTSSPSSSHLLSILVPSYDNPVRIYHCCLVLLSWFIFQIILERLLPAEMVPGTILKTGDRLQYRINGHLSFWITLLVMDIGYPYWDETSGHLQFTRFPLTFLYSNYAEMAFSAIILCVIFSIYIYIKSFTPGALLAEGGNSGNHAYDFFIGRELNPRPTPTSTFDWKVFCELRPGLVGWMILNAAMMMAQKEKLGYVTGSMMLVQVFQGLYVWDAQFQEKAILTTMDVTTDGFGFMLLFGDLAWVPFTYSLQARYLVDYDPHLSLGQLVAVVGLNCVGYFIFRSANSQKDAFRRDPNDASVKHLKYLQTKRGTKLLISGWWGMARKINYTGDWIMGLCWCLVCGFDSIVPYFYAIYFAILLIHRSIRDDDACHKKYGKDWDEYKRIVRYRFIPGLV